MSNGGV